MDRSGSDTTTWWATTFVYQNDSGWLSTCESTFWTCSTLLNWGGCQPIFFVNPRSTSTISFSPFKFKLLHILSPMLIYHQSQLRDSSRDTDWKSSQVWFTKSIRTCIAVTLAISSQGLTCNSTWVCPHPSSRVPVPLQISSQLEMSYNSTISSLKVIWSQKFSQHSKFKILHSCTAHFCNSPFEAVWGSRAFAILNPTQTWNSKLLL